MDIDTSLRPLQDEILAHARAFGLDPFRTVFEVIDHDDLNEVAAYGGLPTRYPHWRFGMEYEALKKGYRWGLQKIYELVINNDPCYAYLMQSNAPVDQKLVMAHVYGHSDFFKNNLWFAHTNRKMVDEMANHGTRIRRYIALHGQAEVETFLDACLSLENLIDLHALFGPHRPRPRLALEAEETPDLAVRKLKSKDYMDRFVNPPEALERQRRRIEELARRRKRFPEEPQKDVLYFLIEHAPLENWQRDVLSIVREEAYYFAPQALTKIMNEGWASYWHSRIMTEKVLAPGELIDYADHHSGTLATQPGSLNPYKLGIELFRDIEDRWNRGAFGKEWEECDDARARETWDRGLGRGIGKIFEVRRVCNDVTFIDHYLTREFCERHKLFVYRVNPQTQRPEIAGRDFEEIKRQILFRLTNRGSPLLAVEDANANNRAELLLVHRHEGADLDLAEARDTLKNLHRLWQRPVHLDTVVHDEKKRLTYDGEKHSEQTL